MKQIRIALLALAATIAAAFGSWFVATSLQPASREQAQISPSIPSPPADSPPLAKPDAAAPAATAGAPEAPAPDPQAIAALEDKLRQATDYQVFFDKMRSVFPAEFALATRTLATSAGAAQAMPAQENAADLFLAEAVRQLRLKRGMLGAKAGTEALDHLFDLHLAVMRKLSTSDPALCVDFLNGAPADTFVAFTAANRALMGEAALAGLLAIDDGAQKKIDRDAPSTQDFDALETALTDKGLDKPAISLLLDGKAPNPPLSEAQMCQNGIAYLETLKSLPEPLRARLYALAIEVTARE